MNNSKYEEKTNDNLNNQLELNSDNNIHSNSENIEEKSQSLLIKVLTEEDFNNDINILHYLQIKELIQLSTICQSLKSILEKYFPVRLKLDYNKIKNIETKNVALKNIYLEKYVQLLFQNCKWFNYDINDSIKKITKLNRRSISQIKGIKNLPKLDEKIYAPFCLIFNYNSKNEKVINYGWKKTAEFIMSDMRFFIRILNLKIENLDNKNITKAFIYLNEIENDIEKIKRFSPYLYELNLWCKGVIIYYYLIHPYKLTDAIKKSLSKDNNDVYNYVLYMDDIINKFYIFKAYLEDKKLIKKILGEYIFNFEFDNKKYNNSMNKEKEIIKLIRNDNKIMSNILSYLNIKEAFKFNCLNKSFYDNFQESLNISIYNILKKIYLLKYNNNTFNELYSLIPTIYENNIFSNYFFMLEDILYPGKNNISNISFLSKDDIDYIKNYKAYNELIEIICKIFCILFNIKIEKAYKDNNSLSNLYIKSVKLCCIKENSIVKLSKYFNIFNLNIIQIRAFYEELSNIYSIDKIKKVKNINKGFYQLLIWELYVYEYIKQFNPFLLLDKEIFLSKCNIKLNENQINIINHYIEYLDKLKKILKIKYHFKNLFYNKNNNKNFSKIIQEFIKEAKIKKIYNNKIDNFIKNNNINKTNIANAYFESKEIIINNNRKNLPILYQKIMEELILENIQKVENSKFKVKNIIKDENYYINYFTSRKNTKYSIISPNKENINKKYKLFTLRNSNINNIKTNLRYTFNININSQFNRLTFSKKEYLSDKIRDKILSKFNRTNFSYIKYLDLNDIYVTKILFYLPIKDFAKISLVNKKFNELIKTHVYIRLFFLEKEKNKIEKKYNEIILSINKKRNEYYIKNKISPPNLHHACILLSSLYKKDIYELRNLFQNYKPHYEIIISILCIFLDIKPNTYINNEGKKIYDFYTPGKKLLYNKNVINIIKKLDIDNINCNIYTKIEKIMESDAFVYDNVINYSPCLINLIKAEFGLMEYFKAIRKYSLNNFDYNILNENEINFCEKINKSFDIYYKIKNYTFNKCQMYHSKAKILLKQIDKEQKLENKISDIDFDNIENNNNN